MSNGPGPVRRLLSAAVVACGVLSWCAGTIAAPRVVATIPAVHSLVAGVMDGVASPYLLLRGGASPHSYALRPSDTRALADADLVFWVGEELESFLGRRLREVTKAGRAISLLHAQMVQRLHLREGHAWAEDHDHGGHSHAARAEREHGELDAHIWLSPHNAAAMTMAIADALSARDPDHADRYRNNADRQIARLRALETEIEQRLAPVRQRPYVVFHDAYQYFEQSFDLQARGAVTLSPERKPGARRLSLLRQALLDGEAVCVFVEPQFEPRLVDSLVEGTKVRVASLDPLGAALEPGPEAYFTLLRGLADSVAECLAVATN